VSLEYLMDKIDAHNKIKEQIHSCLKAGIVNGFIHEILIIIRDPRNRPKEVICPESTRKYYFPFTVIYPLDIKHPHNLLGFWFGKDHGDL
jgi:hypothetical protein